MSQFNRVLLTIIAGVLFILVFATRAHCQVLQPPTTPSQESNSWVTVGMKFVPKQDAIVTGARIYMDGGFIGWTKVYLWSSAGVNIQEANVPSGTGWLNVQFPATTEVKKGLTYTIGYSNENGWHYWQPFFFPKSFPLYDAPSNALTWFRSTYPAEPAYNANHLIEPIIALPVAPPTIRDTIYIRDTVRITDTVLAPVLCPDTTWVFAEGYDTVGARFPDYKIYGQLEFSMPLNQKVRFVRRIEAVWRREELINGQWVEK